MEHTRRGYWLEEAEAVELSPPLREDTNADVVVVGGGFSGLWAAWHIKALEPEARVLLLEAGSCGEGPSGRNGGFCNTMWFSLPSMRQRWGDEPALAVARAAEGSVAGIGSFCEAEGVDAWFRPGGYLQVSTAPAHDETWAKVLASCHELDVDQAVEALSPEQVAARCVSPTFRAGAFYPGAATVQPARLALGLRERLIAAGVEVHETSPVRSLRAGPGGVEARTPAAAIRAGSAVIAVGGAAAAPHGPLRNRIAIASSHIVLTEPVPELLEQIGWTGGECITDSRSLIDYFRTTPDGRILFGWGGGRIAMGARLGGRAELDAGVVAMTAAHLRACFPGLEGRRLTHAWGGPIDASPTHLPIVVPLPGGRTFAAAGYTGNGVGPSHMVGRALASLALDRRDDPSRLPFIDPKPPRLPPQPFQWIGAEAIRQGLMRKEQAELMGLRPDPISAALASIPKRIGFHIGR